jgi:hypothetical protein
LKILNFTNTCFDIFSTCAFYIHPNRLIGLIPIVEIRQKLFVLCSHAGIQSDRKVFCKFMEGTLEISTLAVALAAMPIGTALVLHCCPGASVIAVTLVTGGLGFRISSSTS